MHTAHLIAPIQSLLLRGEIVLVNQRQVAVSRSILKQIFAFFDKGINVSLQFWK
jgi:hypothetical protein